MIDRQQLLKDLQRELPKLEKDILAYSEQNADIAAYLQTEYQNAVEAKRTAEHFVAWRAGQVTQAAAAWLLTCVFVRFLEDNGLLNEPVLAGPVQALDGSQPLKYAKDRMQAYFNDHPDKEERDYLLDVFTELEKFPVIEELLDEKHNPLWHLRLSADGAKLLIDFFQRIDPSTGQIQNDFTDSNWYTRFLGDLYQDLSEDVRKRYALLQTPEFVESFILDYTLEPALKTFGLEKVRLIDPTCGSGHFLLTAFERLFDLWLKREPATNSRELARRALNAVHGVDINPYAVAVCRFRLLIAAMKASGSKKIKDVPDFHFNIACGDSLLHGRRFEWQGQGVQTDMLDDSLKHAYSAEDLKKLDKILGQQYHVVVGNPPYIVVKDKALNIAYRAKYPTCHRKYSLGVPFTERFFDLTVREEELHSGGFMGMITSNSFMKREFGKKLIEEYLPKKDLTHVIDTSGAYIPGHGTPTVIVLARNQSPKSETLTAVLGIRGEPSTPDDATQGLVWRSIVELLESPGASNEFVSVVAQTRNLFANHPWSVGGGGASELKVLIEEDVKTLATRIDLIGFGAILGEDEAFGVPTSKVNSSRLPVPNRPLVEGDQVRDWGLGTSTTVIFPYDEKISLNLNGDINSYLWPLRTLLWERNTFGKLTYRLAGRSFAEYHQIPVERNKIPLSITFAFVATHNHFVLDRGGKVFNRSAPVIKLPAGATEDQHFALLGLLNSSTACFWMKQVFHNKGSTVDVKGARQTTVAFENFYEHTGTGLKDFPVPIDENQGAQQIAQKLDHLSRELTLFEPAAVLELSNKDISAQLRAAKTEQENLLGQMIALQEELDWYVYQLYGLIDEALCYTDDLPKINLGERAFEIALARHMAAGETQSTWFERHGSMPITDIPTRWPADYRNLIERRLQAIEQNPWIKLVEQPEYKRRWNREPWQERQQRALKEWILDRLEHVSQSSGLLTCAQLTDGVRIDADFIRIAELYTGSDAHDLQSLVSELVEGDQVPQMAAARLGLSGIPKFRAWQETWDKQRLEDAIDAEFGVDQPLTEADAADPEKKAAYAAAQKKAAAKKAELVGNIPVPPQYIGKDFRKASYWPLRGKLDVPKERFFSLPGCEKDGDTTLVIGWAGLNHLQRAQAIAGWYIDRKESDGWEGERLLPMLVALEELIPWIKQWHNQVDPEFGERMGEYYEGFLLEELRTLEIDRAALLEWQPAAQTRKRGGRNAKGAA